MGAPVFRRFDKLISGCVLPFILLIWSWVVPVTYVIDSAEKIIRTTCASPLTFEQVIGHFQTLQQDPVCAGYLDVLLDVSEADALPESGQFGAINAELAAVRAKAQFGICAIVATRDAMFGMMRMFEVLARPYFLATRVFRGRPEAEVWLAAERKAANPER